MASVEAAESEGHPPAEKKQKLEEEEEKEEEEYKWVEERDEDFYIDPPDMTDEDYGKYMRQVEASQGFDVEDFPNSFLFCKITPAELLDRHLEKHYNPFSKMAIKHFNAKENANFEFVEVVKANVQACNGGRFYITFKAKDASAATDDGASAITTFQTRVWMKMQDHPDIPKIEVEFCRIKSTQ